MGIYEGDETGLVDAAAAEEHARRAGLRVDADNVLYVRKAILEEYELLKTTLTAERGGLETYNYRYGGDPVSADAAVAFSQRARLLIDTCNERLNELAAIAGSLKLAAEAYGRTEQEIAALTPLQHSAVIAEANATIGIFLRPWDRA
ncbi:hypothetical protein [Pseudonocardia thermophila]|jgi:hypothetical protein|nr:hypothetical protein [Pseudonocardia thermophila]